MDVNSPAMWDFLAPWCKELKGQLISIPSGFIRVLGPRAKHHKPFQFDWENEKEEEDNGEKVGLELDDDESDEEEEEEEEEEFMPMLPWEGGMGYDLIESDDDEDGEEEEEVVENEEENDGDRRDEESSEGEAGENQVEDEDEDGRYVSDEEQYQEVLVVNPDIFKKDWRPERETFISPCFDFISLTGFSESEDPTNPVK